MKTLKWVWKNSYSSIKIFDRSKLIGHIPSFNRKEVGTINGKKFFIDYSPIIFSRPYICDPLDGNKAYCQVYANQGKVTKLTCPAYDYSIHSSGFWPFKRTIYLMKNETRLIEIEIPGGFFVTSGNINILTEFDYEVALYGMFFYNIPEGD